VIVADRCPGVLRPHHAEDGLMVRLRLPGGRTTGRQLALLSALAARHGNDELQLTSRGGVQLRGLPDPVPDALVAALESAGLLPSPDHDLVRNVVCSPLTGIAGRRADLSGLVGELDRALVAEPALAGMPGRFLFALDDGRGDVTAMPFDLGYRAAAPDRGHVLVGDRDHALQVQRAAAAGTMVGLAREFLTARPRFPGRGWHVRDLNGWADSLGTSPLAAPGAAAPPPLGAIGGAASVHVPLGLLTAAQAAAVGRVAGHGPVVLTPWRGVVVPGAAARLAELTRTGLVADDASAWALISACVGAPYCGRTHVETRRLALDLVAGGLVERTHVSGCDRRCGAPAGPHRDLVGAI
jgi:precorrin-3B synthase